MATFNLLPTELAPKGLYQKLATLLKKFTTVEEVSENDRVTLTIKVPAESTGLVIGKGGKTIKAIRNLIKVLATLEKKGVFIQIAEN